jgi:tetratricopeptide (TPR) repeat protein
MLGKVSRAMAQAKDLSGALENAGRSLAAFEALSSADPLNAQARRELAFSHNQNGDLLWGSGRTAEALEHYRKAVAIYEALSAADPGNTQFRRDLAMACGNVGYCLVQAGDERGGLEQFRQSLAIFEALSASNPDNAAARRDLAVSYSYLGDAHSMLADSAHASRAKQLAERRQARSWLQKSLEIYLQMRDRGILRGEDSREPERITRLIAECDAALGKLQPASPTPPLP